MTQMVENLSLKKMEQLCSLIDDKFVSQIINDKKCYINDSGEYFFPRYVTDHKDIDCLFFEYADNESDAKKDLFYDGEWIYIPDFPDADSLFEEAVKQINP